MGYTIKVTTQEAKLFDWALTLHTYDPQYLEYLLRPDIQRLRFQAGQIIIHGKGQFELLEEDAKWLLAILPASFRSGNRDVGFSLRKKLCEALIGKKRRPGSFLTLARSLYARMHFRTSYGQKPANIPRLDKE